MKGINSLDSECWKVGRAGLGGVPSSCSVFLGMRTKPFRGYGLQQDRHCISQLPLPTCTLLFKKECQEYLNPTRFSTLSQYLNIHSFNFSNFIHSVFLRARR